MPIIDIDDLKHGLLPVQQAKARWQQAYTDRRAGSEVGADLVPLFEAEDKTHKAYLDACVTLHGYVQAAVNRAEGRRFDKDE